MSERAGRAQGGASGPRHRREAIASRLSEVLGAPLAGELRQLSSGASRETFLFATAAHGDLVLQVDRGAKPGAGPPPQAALLQAAADAGVPVARVVAHGAQDDALGAGWTIVEALAGGADAPAILSGEGVPPADELLDQIAAALAAVHRMPADGSLAPVIEDPIASLRATYDALGEPHPVFELAFRALGDGPPATAPRRRTFVHGDFRMGNLMVAERGLTGVLDWELAHVGDPVEDLGWLCVPAWRFSGTDRPAAGLGSREQLLDAYGRHAGVAVDPAALAWWELAGTLRWGVICVMQAFTHLSGAARSVEHAVIGRRACEVEWDLLETLSPDTTTAAGADGRASAATPQTLHDRPTAAELLDAARGALGDEVLGQLEGRAAFQTRVVLRALGIAIREIEAAPRHARVHATVLEQLGAVDDAALAAAVRAGEFDRREQQLCAGLRALVACKLEAANPRHPAITVTKPSGEGT